MWHLSSTGPYGEMTLNLLGTPGPLYSGNPDLLIGHYLPVHPQAGTELAVM